MHEGVANHFSLAVSDDGKQFLMNPDARHFSKIKASELLLLDADDPATMNRADAPDPTAWTLHGRIHATCPSALRASCSSQTCDRARFAQGQHDPSNRSDNSALLRADCTR